MNHQYSRTLRACYTGYIVQAIINNFVPLLFITFHTSYAIPMTQITLLITINFMIQLVVDILSAFFVDRIGYRYAMLIAHGCAAAGLIGLIFLPVLLPSPFSGLLISVTVYALGGGLLEVLLSPIVEALPTNNKEKTMSLLHSFYCWGHVGVVFISTVFFALVGLKNWKIMALIWAIIPLYNLFVFKTAPLCSLTPEADSGLPLHKLVCMPPFWILMVIMTCAGASEQAVSQWASAFAEQALGVEKSIGDLCGPMFFAICMGASRLLYGLYGERLNLKKAMIASSILCVIAYVAISLASFPVLSLIGCGICGFSVGIMWPGTFSIAAIILRGGGTALFAFMALAGDLGCSLGPTFAGLIAGQNDNDLKLGILCSVIFPILLITGIIFLKKAAKSSLQ